MKPQVTRGWRGREGRRGTATRPPRHDGLHLEEVADGINAEMGHHAPAARFAPARPARPGGRTARPRLHRRLVERGQRHGRVRPAGRRGPVDHRAAVRHRDRRDLHPRAGVARHGRGDLREPGSRPVRAWHRHLLTGDRGGLERAEAGPALPAGQGHAEVPASRARRGEGERGIRDVHRARVPPRSASGAAAGARTRRPAAGHGAARRHPCGRGDHQLARPRRRADGARGGRAGLRADRPDLRLSPPTTPPPRGPSAAA